MARRNSFDFPYTCPKIDKAINDCKYTLESYLSDYIEDLCPHIPNEEVKRISKDWSEQMYEAISDYFEIVRKTNEEMRDEANRQIAYLENRILALEEEIKSLEKQLDDVF